MKGPERPPDAAVQLEEERRLEGFRRRRDRHVGAVVLGVAFLFAAVLSWVLGAVGAALVLYGATAYFYWNQRMKSVYDPWKDPELDAWEKEYLEDLERER